MANQLDLANAALSVLGATPITATDDGSAEADAFNSIWETCRRQLFSETLWQCLRTMVRPQEAPAEDIDEQVPGWKGEGWQKAYDLPNKLIGIYGIVRTDHGEAALNPHTDTAYDTALGKYLLVYEANPIILKYTRDLPPKHWPRYLEAPMTYLLAQNLAILLTDDTAKVNAFKAIYQEQLDSSTWTDSASVPQRPTKSRIPGVRQGGGLRYISSPSAPLTLRRTADGGVENA